jgi:hypothetical protein
MPIQLTIVRGGMIEFARTGIYPEYLQFYFPEENKRWRVKLQHEVQSGFLRSKGEILIFNIESMKISLSR